MEPQDDPAEKTAPSQLIDTRGEGQKLLQAILRQIAELLHLESTCLARICRRQAA